MEKLWNPQLFNKVLDNWSENPFSFIILLDFTTPDYLPFWDRSIEVVEGGTPINELNFDCPADYDEIGMGYWFGLEDGCICNGEFGGEYNNGYYNSITPGECNT